MSKMAELGRTVRVSGLPTELEEDRLEDKILIHFLRTRNGGGEIDSVTTIKAASASALITFEESEVAQRVIQQNQHILEVDGKKYQLTVTEHHEGLDADKVILSLSATLNCSQLSGGRTALTSLHRSNPDVQINYSTTGEFCTLSGSYSKVQAALAQLLGQTESPQSEQNSGPLTNSDYNPSHTTPAPHVQESDDQTRKRNKKREKQNTEKQFNEYKSSVYRDLTPGGYAWEDTGQVEGATAQPPGLPPTSDDDFSLIVDADMFQYLQKQCGEEYHHILRQYNVEVVDFTHQGLTTLLLQGEGSRDQEHLRRAKKEISRLYQENETKICRSQLPKSILSPKGGLKRALEKLNLRLPKLLLNEDEKNVYIIGSSDYVSEAKQFLLLDHGEVGGKKEDEVSPRRFSFDSSTSADEARPPLGVSPAARPVDDLIDQMVKSGEDEKKAEGSTKYKIAAQFKDSRLTPLGGKTTDFTLRGSSYSNRPTRPGPMLGHDVLMETKGTSEERVSGAGAQNSGGDVLFKIGNAFPSSVSMQNKTSPTSDLLDTRPKDSAFSISTSPFDKLGGGSLPPAGSGAALKRASSFSGMTQQKTQNISQESQDDPVKARGRSSSFSNSTKTDKQEVYSAEITVNRVIWRYIKEAYGTRVEDLTSEVHMREKRSEGTPGPVIVLKGANKAKVSSCQLGLQKLIDTVGEDFAVQSLKLSDLGVTDAADENLQACCDEIRGQFRKVTPQILEKNLYLLGPQQLCSQVSAFLYEVFSGGSAQIAEHDFSNTSPNLHHNGNLQPVAVGHTGKTEVRDGFQEKPDLMNGSVSQLSLRKDPVIKEKVKRTNAVQVDGRNAEEYVGSSAKNDSVNGAGSVTADGVKNMTLRKKDKDIKDSTGESTSGQGVPAFICVCGTVGTSLKKTECGVTMCSKCLDKVHIHCRVCQKKEPTSWGISGKMSSSKLHISLPGYSRHPAIKITYCIPDGIQGEHHPSPGKPFQGGTFEAFLPDCETSRKLLPRLQEAFRQGLTFTVTGRDTGARVIWDGIPHKTSVYGAKSGNGYPDSTYLTRLSEVLTSHGIEESPAKSQK
ncbi:uncharacterized protein LOC115424347 isoform X2 [Sphaeramia orbicularis]|uniref:RING-type E3 ubiquitin transferase n=1 Tax=Sphaeramia orbicularis TaxID=375764 RepID=A0A673A291_9TELE|nr:uncharacterized protein LOC115424347 isoform X2 [Sphaeramia orbicularis]